MSEIRFLEQVEPDTPPANKAVLYVDSVDGRVAVKNDAGNVQRLLAGGAFTETFVSSQQPIVSAGGIMLPHGLSNAPSLIIYQLINLSAEKGYAIGDVTQIGLDHDSTTNRGMSIVTDVTNITIRFGLSAQVFTLIDKGSGSRGTITNGNWDLQI